MVVERMTGTVAWREMGLPSHASGCPAKQAMRMKEEQETNLSLQELLDRLRDIFSGDEVCAR